MKCKGFTFIEILAALAVTAIGLVALIQLQIVSIAINNNATLRTRAALLAREKMDLTLAGFVSHSTSAAGIVKQGGVDYNWKTQINKIDLDQLGKNDVAQLCEVKVNVSWGQGDNNKLYQLRTFVTDRNKP